MKQDQDQATAIETAAVADAAPAEVCADCGKCHGAGECEIPEEAKERQKLFNSEMRPLLDQLFEVSERLKMAVLVGVCTYMSEDGGFVSHCRANSGDDYGFPGFLGHAALVLKDHDEG